MRVAAIALLFSASHALPGDTAHFPSSTESCSDGICTKPTKKYEMILNTKPGQQWNDAGGYCGSWSIQRAAMAKGAWISQQQVRDHTVAGGGNDEEILETNIDLALANLKLKAEAWDYKNMPIPQYDAFRKWIKKQLAAGNPLVMMIMLPLGTYPVYPGLPYGLYSHIEPFVGVMSDHPLSDDTLYEDDYIVHYNDNGLQTYYRAMSSLLGTFEEDQGFNFADCPDATGGSMMCLHPQYGFGWAVTDLNDARKGLPLSLVVEPSESEPDLRAGESPSELKGTISVQGLEPGEKYAVYRWDSVESAFDYTNPTSVYRFSASQSEQSFTDKKTISSDGTTYYRCIVDAADYAV